MPFQHNPDHGSSGETRRADKGGGRGGAGKEDRVTGVLKTPEEDWYVPL